jgi:hypothetical protein
MQRFERNSLRLKLILNYSSTVTNSLKYDNHQSVIMKQSTIVLLVVATFFTVFFLASISGVALGQRFAGVWRTGGDAQFVFVDADFQHFMAKMNELAAQNLRLVDIERYTDANNNPLFAGVFRTGGDAQFVFVDADFQHFMAKMNELAAQNLRLVDLNRYN